MIYQVFYLKNEADLFEFGKTRKNGGRRKGTGEIGKHLDEIKNAIYR